VHFHPTRRVKTSSANLSPAKRRWNGRVRSASFRRAERSQLKLIENVSVINWQLGAKWRICKDNIKDAEPDLAADVFRPFTWRQK
jgi:hypothetical protein